MTRPDEQSTIVFVYNADSGVFNLAADIAHKIFSPQTYACNLCALTHSNFGMRKQWKTFLDTLENPLEFLHADEFKNKYSFENAEFPAIFKRENGVLSQIVNTAEINDCKNLEALEKLLVLNRSNKNS